METALDGGVEAEMDYPLEKEAREAFGLDTEDAHVKAAKEFFGLYDISAKGDGVRRWDALSLCADYFAATVKLRVNPPDGQQVDGNFGDVMETLNALWLGFRNSCIVTTFRKLKGTVVTVEQRYHHVLLDSAGVEVAGTTNELAIKHLLTFNEDCKICEWQQDFDASSVEAARATLADKVEAHQAMILKVH